jgi:hypothetical protein
MFIRIMQWDSGGSGAFRQCNFIGISTTNWVYPIKKKKMNTLPPIPTWRCFENMTPGPEAASVAASCSFSLATLEIASLPDSSGFALTERKQPEIWRWAVIGPVGFLLEEGFEATQAEAKLAAAEALHLILSAPNGAEVTS